MTNSSLKGIMARKAAKATAKHTTRGTVSKLKRDPVRTTTLLALGGVFGFAAGRFSAALLTPSSQA